MPDHHPYGEPISILKFSNTKEVIIDHEELDKIFDHPEIQDHKVVILSVIGVFRGGKSFFLDYCLRFLYANFPSVKHHWKQKTSSFQINKNWMGLSYEPLKGFSWRSGFKRDTIGIIMWNDVFLHTMDDTGEKIAIFVMDTQGLFDHESTQVDNARIFSLGTLISSIQVLNVLNRIQEDQLQYLQFATEFTKFAAVNTCEKPFQNLIFIVRDWNNSSDFGYGLSGGQEYINEILASKPDQKSVLQSVRESIYSCFDNIECSLMPHPGKRVTCNQNYNGNWDEMDKKFKNEIMTTIQYILDPLNLVMKKSNGCQIKVNDMKDLISSYLESIKTNEDISALTFYELTVERQIGSLIKKCINEYKWEFAQIKEFYYNIDEVHKICKDSALVIFDNERKMGSTDQIKSLRIKLEQETETTFDILKKDKPFFITVFIAKAFSGERLTSYFKTKMTRLHRFNYRWSSSSDNGKIIEKPEEIATDETITPAVTILDKKTTKQKNEDLVKSIMSMTIYSSFGLAIFFMIVGFVITIQFLGTAGVIIVLVLIASLLYYKLHDTGIQIADLIRTGCEIIAETSESITHAAMSISKVASASATAMSAVKYVTNVFRK